MRPKESKTASPQALEQRAKMKELLRGAVSYGKAVASALVEEIDEDTLRLRQQQCFAPCPELVKGGDGFHYCGACRCPHRKASRLDGPGFTKLHFPNLECPLKRPGFSNGEQP